MNPIFPIILLFSLFTSSSYAFHCVDETNEAIDYWVGFKGPDTFDYTIYTSKKKKLQKSMASLTSHEYGSLANTVKQLWDEKANFIIYNDESPLDNQPYNFKLGHTKGILAFSEDGGFWLTHSVPKFALGPTQVSQYQGITTNAHMYGQSFFCKSFTVSQLNDIAGVLLYNHPNIQDMTLHITNYANLTALSKQQYQTSHSCETLTVENLTVFAKSKEFGKDLYGDCIAPYYQSNLKVESWLRGDLIGAVCNDYKIVDGLSIQLDSNDFSEHQDHSKYAVGEDSLVCFADINRMTTQFQRGGGAVCFQDKSLHTLMESMIQTTNHCYSEIQ